MPATRLRRLHGGSGLRAQNRACAFVLVVVQVLHMRLGSILRKYRLMADLDVRSVAGEIGISHSTLSRVERGEACDSKTLTKILAYLLEEV